MSLVFIVCYGIAKEITRGSIMCHYLTTNDLVYDQMKIVCTTSRKKSFINIAYELQFHKIYFGKKWNIVKKRRQTFLKCF